MSTSKTFIEEDIEPSRPDFETSSEGSSDENVPGFNSEQRYESARRELRAKALSSTVVPTRNSLRATSAGPRLGVRKRSTPHDIEVETETVTAPEMTKQQETSPPIDLEESSDSEIDEQDATYGRVLLKICREMEWLLTPVDLFPSQLDELCELMSVNRLNHIKNATKDQKFPQFVRVFNNFVRRKAERTAQSQMSLNVADEQQQTASSSGKSKSKRLHDSSHTVNETSSSTMNDSFAKLLHDQRASNWSFRKFEPKEDEIFRAGEFVRFIHDFKSFAEAGDYTDKEMLQALWFKSGDVITEAIQTIKCSRREPFRSCDEMINALRHHWEFVTNPQEVENRFKKLKRESNQTCVGFIRRLVYLSPLVTKLFGYKEYEIARENLIIQTIATGINHKRLQEDAQLWLNKYKPDDKSTRRLELLESKAKAIDDVSTHDREREEQRGANFEVRKVEPPPKRKRFDNPQEFLHQSNNAREENQRRAGGGHSSQRTGSAVTNAPQQNRESSLPPRKQKCDMCKKMHDLRLACPKCRECFGIGHFQFEKHLCPKAKRTTTELEQKGKYTPEFTKAPSAQYSNAPSTSTSRPKQTVKYVEKPEVSNLDDDDDDFFCE